MKVQGSKFEVQGGRVLAGGRGSLTANHSRGFSLIECLVYISVFALVMFLAMQLFFQTRDSADRFRRSADDLTRALHAGELWRDDVRAATASPRVVTENGQTWLAIPRGTNTVVYTHFKNTVWRQADTNAPWSRALAGVRASRMEPDARAHVTAWRWELELAVKDERKKTRPLFTFLTVAPAATQPEK
jgi:type II secretory pathway pseudopilin PulG